MKICKQCGKTKTEESFRRNAARGKGIYKTTQGYHNFCKECESINSRAIALEKAEVKDEKTIQLLVDYYASLEAAGLGVATAVAGRYLGKDKIVTAAQPKGLEALIAHAITENQIDTVLVHLNKLRTRSYDNASQAGAEHARLKKTLKDRGLYEEADKLLEDWEYDEEKEDD